MAGFRIFRNAGESRAKARLSRNGTHIQQSKQGDTPSWALRTVRRMLSGMKRNKKKAPVSPYKSYRDKLSEQDSQTLDDFFVEFESHCSLPREEKAKLRSDFENALAYYSDSGVRLSVALERLSISKLGGFYSRPAILWYALDDAAKIYPLSMKRGQMAVFRLSVYLKEDIVPELLQMALTFTIKRFPSFATTVKKGVFWHYLDTAKRRYVIGQDNGLPCHPLKIARSGSQSFRVMYYKNRISVEFFHILTDGTGGLIFLKTLTAEYLRLTGMPSACTEGALDIGDPPRPEETANEFCRAEKTDKSSGFVDKRAVQMSGKLSKTRPFRVLHFNMNAKTLREAAKKHDATITAYILAQLFLAGRYATDEFQGEMSIQVPVNMRKFYPSDTVRNFSMYCGIRLPIGAVTSADGILPEISRQLTEKASRKSMNEMMNSTKNMVNAVRYVPLFIKAPAARLVYGFLGDRIFSNTLSNLGVVKMPPELSEQIESMDFILGTALTNRAGCGLVTYGNTATLTLSKFTTDPSFEERLYDLLRLDGIELRVDGSEAHES